MCAVVKADAYGHGASMVATAAVGAGASCLAVASLEEAVTLRETGCSSPILLLCEPLPSDLATVQAMHVSPLAYTRQFVRSLLASDAEVRVHVKIDTGMHRLGTDGVTGLELCSQLAEASLLGGVATHLAAADTDPEFTRIQLARFSAVTAGLESAGIQVPRHAANTAGVLAAPESRLDMARVGIGLYGVAPCRLYSSPLALSEVLRLEAPVVYTQRQSEGSRPSYGRLRALETATWLATVQIGYADGLPRSAFDAGVEVLAGGKRCPLAGMVTMNQIIVDTGETELSPGDPVVLIGSQGDERVTVEEWARRMKTVPHEILSRLGRHVPRAYEGQTEGRSSTA